MDEIVLQLKSHKITDRRKGRKALEEQLQGQRKVPPDTALRLLNAAAQYVERELESSQVKGKTPLGDVAVLFRKCVSTFGECSLSLVQRLVQLMVIS